ncbi:hypothetical protein HDU76_007348 [Blyttiomyces sp. JEL0837]|nr:hypothetical protein HDU76_007348 [Blyttiomyces sp. JEL0837]
MGARRTRTTRTSAAAAFLLTSSAIIASVSAEPLINLKNIADSMELSSSSSSKSSSSSQSQLQSNQQGGMFGNLLADYQVPLDSTKEHDVSLGSIFSSSSSSVGSASSLTGSKKGNNPLGPLINTFKNAAQSQSQSQSSSNVPSDCISINQNQACAPWNTGLYINKTALSTVYGLTNTNAIQTSQDWESLVIAMSSGGAAQKKAWNDYLSCSGYNGEVIQYHRTYVCMTDVFYFSAGCNAAMDAPVPENVLCVDTCKNYGSAVKNLVMDSKACPVNVAQKSNGVNAAGGGDASQWKLVEQRRVSTLQVDSVCQNIVGNWKDAVGNNGAGQCNVAVNDDLNSCGFAGDVKAANAYCDATKNTPSDCCNAFRSAMQQNYVFQNVSSFSLKNSGASSSYSSSSSSNVNKQQSGFGNQRPAVVAARPYVDSILSVFNIKQLRTTYNQDSQKGAAAIANNVPIQNFISKFLTASNDGPSVASTDNNNGNNNSSSSGSGNMAVVIGVSVSVGLLAIGGVAAAVIYSGRRKRNRSRVSIRRPNAPYGSTTSSSANEMSSSGAFGSPDSKKLLTGTGLPAPANPERYRVTFGYTPSLPDELELKPGQIVEVSETFDDGWGKARNLDTGLTGTFPMACCVPA